MKKNLLLLTFSLVYQVITFAANPPDFQILSSTYTTSTDTLKPSAQIKADTALLFTVGIFISNDATLDASDELRIFSTNTSQKNATLTFNASINFTGQLIDSNVKYLITVVTHQFEGSPQDFNLANLKPDANPTNNFKITPFSFSPAVVKTHNAPLTNTGGGSGMTPTQAAALLTMPSYESVSYPGAGTIWKATDSPVFDLQYNKDFKIKNDLSQDLNQSIIKVYLSKDNSPTTPDFLIHQETKNIPKNAEIIFASNDTKRLAATTQADALTEISSYVYWPNNTPIYGDLAKTYIFVTVTFTLGDTATITKTFGHGGTSTFTYKTFVISGLDSETKSDFTVDLMANKNLTINSAAAGKCELLNTAGISMKNSNLLAGQNTLNVRDLPNGIYIIRVETQNGISSERIYIQ